MSHDWHYNAFLLYRTKLLCFLSSSTGPPDPPTNVDIQNTINRRDYVNVTWTLGKSNSSPIRKVVIQCTTQFSPHTWETIAEETDPDKGWTQISLSPWRQYTFRVVAVNGIGNSTPSSPSSSFQAPPTGRSFVYFLQITGYWEHEILIRAIGIELQKLRSCDYSSCTFFCANSRSHLIFILGNYLTCL